MVSTAILTASRQAALRAAPRNTLGSVRFAHIENTIDNCVPFKTGPKYKTRLAFGVTGFLVSGFSLPFIAAWFQRHKAGA